MYKNSILFLSVVFTGLLSGLVLGMFLDNPLSLSASTYVEHQKNLLSALQIPIPIFGFGAIATTLVWAILQKRDKTAFAILLIATGLLIINWAVTIFGNQPINTIIVNSDIKNIPSNWQELRDRWWMFHTLRTIAAILSFCLVSWNIVRNFKKD